MATLLSSTKLKRRPPQGFTQAGSFWEGPTLKTEDLLVIEPAFRDFATANDAILGLPFEILSQQLQLPEAIILNISYGKSNARVFKGYLLDVVAAYKKAGYSFFTSMHLPYESYGSPMVGSVLSLMFGQQYMAFNPAKKIVFPRDMWPDWVRHSLHTRGQASVYAGFGSYLGYVDSGTHFLPDLSLWGAPLPYEIKNGNSLENRSFSKEDVDSLFAVTEYPDLESLHLATPAPILTLLAENFVKVKLTK